jgi:hypothetical protein
MYKLLYVGSTNAQHYVCMYTHAYILYYCALSIDCIHVHVQYLPKVKCPKYITRTQELSTDNSHDRIIVATPEGRIRMREDRATVACRSSNCNRICSRRGVASGYTRSRRSIKFEFSAPLLLCGKVETAVKWCGVIDGRDGKGECW